MLKASFQISVVNDTTQATPTNFQQFIYTTLQYPSGVRFWSPTDGWLYGWLESLSSTNQAVIWIKIPSSIPANGVYQIYMVEDSSLNFDGVYWGEAPQLSSSYGQYDNGGNVFGFYDNFAGTSLNTSKWTSYYSSYITVNNGITFGSGGLCFIDTNSKYSISNIVEMYVNSGIGSDSGIMYAVDVNGNQYTNAGYGEWISVGPSAGQAYNGSENDMRSSYAIDNLNNGYGTPVSYTYPSAPLITGVVVPNSVNGILYINDIPVVTDPDSIPPQGNYYITLGGYESNLNVYYVRTRDYPPNGVMPATAIVPVQAWEVFVPYLP